LWPDNKVFIDARYFPFHTWYDEYNEFCYENDRTLKELFINKYACDLWCLSYYFPQLEYFISSPDWKLVYYGPSACIFLSKHIPYHDGHEISASIYNVSFNQKLYISRFALAIGDFDISKRLLTHLKPSLFSAQQKNLVIGRLLSLGNAMYAYNKFADAIDVFSYIITIEPDSALFYTKKGLAEVQIGKFTQAIESYKEAIRLNPNSDMAYYNLANVLMTVHNFDEAINCFSKVLQIDPQNSFARRNLAIALENKKLLKP
jgi:tetratricopeptide (TPR) repeat protein